MAKPPSADGHTWYVAFRNLDEVPGVYASNSTRFDTEIEAKVFAAQNSWRAAM
jgi:hypothetical protein